MMAKFQHMASFNKVAKWLLKATLLLSLSTFSGYAYSTQQGLAIPAKTELKVAGNPVVKRHISYRHGLSKTISNPFISGFCQFKSGKTSLISDQLFKTAFDVGSRQFVSFNRFPGFQFQKTIPKGSDEGLPYLFMG